MEDEKKFTINPKGYPATKVSNPAKLHDNILHLEQKIKDRDQLTKDYYDTQYHAIRKSDERFSAIVSFLLAVFCPILQNTINNFIDNTFFSWLITAVIFALVLWVVYSIRPNSSEKISTNPDLEDADCFAFKILSFCNQDFKERSKEHLKKLEEKANKQPNKQTRTKK